MTIAALRRIQDEAKLTTAQVLENVEFLLSSCTPAAIALRLGTTMEAIEKHYERAGRPDLALPFNNAAKIEQRHRPALPRRLIRATSTSGSRWPYRSLVIATLACPRRLETARAGWPPDRVQ